MTKIVEFILRLLGRLFGRPTLPRHVAKLASWGVADQALSSVTNFAVSVAAARLLGPADFGSFAFAYAGFIILLGINRTFLVQPFVVSSASLDGEELRKATASGVAAVLSLGLVAGLVLMIVSLTVGFDDPTGRTFMVLAVTITPLLVQDFWRYVGFTTRRPAAAAANDATWAIAQVMAFVAVGIFLDFTAPVVVACWAAGATAGAIIGFLQFETAPVSKRELGRWLKANASLGGWFTLASVAYTVGAQTVTIVIGSIGGRSSLAGMRTVVTLFGPAQLLRDASEGMVLPYVSRAVGKSGETAWRIAAAQTVLLSAVMGLFALAVLIFDDFIISFVFGDRFLQFLPYVLPIALNQFLGTWGYGAAVGLRAARAGRQLATVQCFLMVIWIALATLLVANFGVVVALWGSNVVMLLRTALLWAQYGKELRTFAAGGTDDGSLEPA